MWRAKEDGGMKKRYSANATATIVPLLAARLHDAASEVRSELYLC